MAGKYFVYSTLTIQCGTTVMLDTYKLGKMALQYFYLNQMFIVIPMNIFSVSASAIVTLNGSSDYVEIYGLGENSSGTPSILGNANGESIFGAQDYRSIAWQ